MNAPRKPQVIRAGLGDVVATLPAVMGYQPGDGDVAFVLLDQNSRVIVSGNLPSQEIGPNIAAASAQVSHTAKQNGAKRAVVIGYGQDGPQRADIVRSVLSEAVRDVVAVAVEDGRLGQLEAHGTHVHEWSPLPDPLVPLVATRGAPAPSREARRVDAQPLVDQQVPDHVSARAHQALAGATGTVGTYADEALTLLAKAGPKSSDAVRATFGALVGRDLKVRDVVIAAVVEDGNVLVDNLIHAARTASTRDRETLYTTAAAVQVIIGQGGPLVEGLLEYAGNGNLARLARTMNTAPVPPDMAREGLAAIAQDARNEELRALAPAHFEAALPGVVAPGVNDPTQVRGTSLGGPGL